MRPTVFARQSQRSFRRLSLLVLYLAALALLAPLAWIPFSGVSVSSGPNAANRVYSVRAVGALLQAHPAALRGSSIRVRGVAWPCLGLATDVCLGQSPMLTDPSAVVGLALGRQTEKPLLAFMHRLPFVDRFLPPAQTIEWGEPATYRVKIRALPITSCAYWPCYEAELLDVSLTDQW